MSIHALNWAFRQRLGGRSSEKFVLIDLADHANDHDLAWPRIEFIAQRTELSEATVIRAIKSLREWGLIEREKRRSVIGRPRANLYRLRTDRTAPPELAAGVPVPAIPDRAEDMPDDETEPTVMVTVGGKGTENTRDNSDASKDAVRASLHGDTHQNEPTNLHGDTHMGVMVQVTNRTTTIEPNPPNPPTENLTQPSPARNGRQNPAAHEPAQDDPPLAPSGTAAPGWGREADHAKTEAEDLAEGFEQMVDGYQQANKLQFLGERKPAWKAWRRKTKPQRVKGVACISNFIKGCNAEYARWASAKTSERGRRPKFPTLSEYIGYDMWDAMGTPRHLPPKPDNTYLDLCRTIAERRGAQTCWVVEGSEAWAAWVGFFRKHGGRLPVRPSSFSDQYDCGAKKGERGWRFPTDFPPGPKAAADHGEEFVTEHYGSSR